jgi:hypothetical protein
MSDINENTDADASENASAGENVSVIADVRGNEKAAVKKLEVGETLKEGVEFTITNIGPILVNFLLWILTILIPYINVGTTIGMYTGIISKLSRRETISFTEIFDPKYRKYMGEYFLVMGLMFIGVFIGILFLIVPGIIISLAWGFAALLVIDKGKNPTEALTLSNNITYGNKGRIFLITILTNLIFSVPSAILTSFNNSFATFLSFIVVIFQIFVTLGIQASMYKQLAGDVLKSGE